VKPPVCYLCGLDLHDLDGRALDHFTLVFFALTPEEEAADRARDEAGWTGHPQNAVWFCTEHAHLGEERSGLHWREALGQISALRRR
jgi:hypothetical protein